MRLLAIDPGSEHSGFVEYAVLEDSYVRIAGSIRTLGTIVESGVETNEEILARCWRREHGGGTHLAIELINVFGKANSDVFRTCIWHGRFVEAWGAVEYSEITRAAVKQHLCGTARSGDSDVRAALVSLWGGEARAIGGKGRGKAKTAPGPLHGVTSHAWSALGVAVTWADLRQQQREAERLASTKGAA